MPFVFHSCTHGCPNPVTPHSVSHAHPSGSIPVRRRAGAHSASPAQPEQGCAASQGPDPDHSRRVRNRLQLVPQRRIRAGVWVDLESALPERFRASTAGTTTGTTL
eukprot:495728-Rhodomonas_salina.1